MNIILQKLKMNFLWRKRHLKRVFVERFVMLHYNEKRSLISKYARKYSLQIFIETGTLFGDTAALLCDNFDELYTIELSAELASKAKKRFSNESKIKVIEGDSGIELEKILRGRNEKICFWLDGHYSHSFVFDNQLIITARGDLETPIVTEINTIFKYCKTGCVILIDDSRLFNGLSDYPTYAALKKSIHLRNSKAKITNRRDIIRVIF